MHGRSGHPADPTLLPLDPPPGAALVLYTDGLVQRRNELIDTDIERVADGVRSGPADALCDHVMATTAEEHRTTTSPCSSFAANHHPTRPLRQPTGRLQHPGGGL
ncbi:SpoIIE family protein phosphatase [Micromonospora parva]|uniref:SpoIIE family protein phosphatase n=1 Tax=Micromonospora parva TaxID=1464048 RepID=A0ABW6VP71_9ACTN